MEAVEAGSGRFCIGKRLLRTVKASDEMAVEATGNARLFMEALKEGRCAWPWSIRIRSK